MYVYECAFYSPHGTFLLLDKKWFSTILIEKEEMLLDLGLSVISLVSL